MVLRRIVFASILFMSACSFHAKNLKPETPVDFSVLRQMALYAQSAYDTDAATRQICSPAFNEVTIQTIASTNNRYFLATSTTTSLHLISIAGTANLQNALLDGDLSQEFVPELNISLHRGFARAARLVYADVKPRLKPGYRIQVTGHSLGGAEAVILGMLFQKDGTPVERIITFGQPKVSNQAGVDAYANLPLTRVINERDIVPEMPLEPFRHIGPELVIFTGENYSLVTRRPFDPATLIDAWKAIQNHQAPAQLPDHFIANYLIDLNSKQTASQLIPYPKQ